jgi:hypothetical protein
LQTTLRWFLHLARNGHAVDQEQHEQRRCSNLA